jgi:hypothetical protein
LDRFALPANYIVLRIAIEPVCFLFPRVERNILSYVTLAILPKIPPRPGLVLHPPVEILVIPSINGSWRALRWRGVEDGRREAIDEPVPWYEV